MRLFTPHKIIFPAPFQSLSKGEKGHLLFNCQKKERACYELQISCPVHAKSNFSMEGGLALGKNFNCPDYQHMPNENHKKFSTALSHLEHFSNPFLYLLPSDHLHIANLFGHLPNLYVCSQCENGFQLENGQGS